MFDNALIVADNKIATALNVAVLSKRALTPFITEPFYAGIYSFFIRLL